MVFISPEELKNLELKAKLWKICCKCEVPSICNPEYQWRFYEQNGEFACENLNSEIFKSVTVNYLINIPEGYHYEWAAILKNVYTACLEHGKQIHSENCCKIGKNLKEVSEEYENDSKDGIDKDEIMYIRILMEDTDEDKKEKEKLEKMFREGRKED